MQGHPASYYDLIILDVDMPNLTGNEVCRLVLDYTRRPVDLGEPQKYPMVYAVTGNIDPKAQAVMLAAGFDRICKCLLSLPLC